MKKPDFIPWLGQIETMVQCFSPLFTYLIEVSRRFGTVGLEPNRRRGGELGLGISFWSILGITAIGFFLTKKKKDKKSGFLVTQRPKDKAVFSNEPISCLDFWLLTHSIENQTVGLGFFSPHFIFYIVAYLLLFFSWIYVFNFPKYNFSKFVSINNKKFVLVIP